MAIGWLTILKMVPWSDVVSNAPKIAEGAKKLWDAAGKKPAPGARVATAAQARLSPGAQELSGLESRITDVQAAVADLQKEMVDSSRIVKALADQNTQLVQRVLWLRRALVVVAIAAATSLVLLLAR